MSSNRFAFDDDEEEEEEEEDIINEEEPESRATTTVEENKYLSTDVNSYRESFGQLLNSLDKSHVVEDMAETLSEKYSSCVDIFYASTFFALAEFPQENKKDALLELIMQVFTHASVKPLLVKCDHILSFIYIGKEIAELSSDVPTIFSTFSKFMIKLHDAGLFDKNTLFTNAQIIGAFEYGFEYSSPKTAEIFMTSFVTPTYENAVDYTEVLTKILAVNVGAVKF